MFVSTKAFMLAALADIIRAASTSPAGTLNSVKVHLYSIGPVLSPDMAVADFTEIAFTGYAAATLTFGVPFVDGHNKGAALGVEVTFVPSAVISPPVSALGYYVTNTGGTVLYGAEAFATPKQFSDVVDSLTVILPWEESGSANPAVVID